MGDVDGVVGEAFVVATEQGDVNGGSGAVRPIRVEDFGEQVIAVLRRCPLVIKDKAAQLGNFRRAPDRATRQASP